MSPNPVLFLCPVPVTKFPAVVSNSLPTACSWNTDWLHLVLYLPHKEKEVKQLDPIFTFYSKCAIPKLASQTKWQVLYLLLPEFSTWSSEQLPHKGACSVLWDDVSGQPRIPSVMTQWRKPLTKCPWDPWKLRILHFQRCQGESHVSGPGKRW